MKLAAEWLQSYLGEKISLEKLTDALVKSGVEIEAVIDQPELDQKIVVAEVVDVYEYPEAHNLRVAVVNDGQAKIKVVCGASNVRAGMKAALAGVGAKLPDGTQIKVATIRGQQSNGMLCSEAELGRGTDHSGLLELDPELIIGQPLAEIMPAATVLDVKTAPNRSDLQSVVGLAREVAAQLEIELKLPKADEPAAVKKPAVAVELKAKLEEVKRYMAAKLELPAELPATPDYLRQRLLSAGIRPINVVVDVTNYVMLEWGQPLHAFAAESLKLPIVVRLAKAGEKLTTLDGVERKLTAHDLVIADAKAIHGLAGVMGGEQSQVKAGTRSIVLESATFNGTLVRRSAQRQGLRTEASARFEHGLPVQLAPVAMARAISLLEELADAKLVSPVTDELQVWPWIQHIGLRQSRWQAMTGIEMSRDKLADQLVKLGFEAEKFNIVDEAKKHLDKPYIWGASFKTHGVDAFDCGYLIDYVYSLIGIPAGHTATQQSESGAAVHTEELKPGDVLYRGGPWEKTTKEERKGVSHTVMYAGEGKIIHANDRRRGEDGGWLKLDKPRVLEESVDTMLKDPEYLGARRYAENLDDYVAVTAPWWRLDVKTEADVIEEVMKLVGYDELEATLPPQHTKNVDFDQWWPKVWDMKDWLKSVGLFEAHTYSFVSGAILERLNYQMRDHLKLKNPLSQEQAYLRRDLLPSLLLAVEANDKYRSKFGIFEISRVFQPEKSDKKASSSVKKETNPPAGELPAEPTYGAVMVRDSSGQAYRRVKAALDLLANRSNVTFELKPDKAAAFHPARMATIWSGKHSASRRMGKIGELHPDIVAASKVKGALGYLELELEAWFAAMQPKVARATSKFPPVWRDLALLVKPDVTWQDINQAAADHVTDISFLSDFTEPDGRKSLAVRIRLESPEKTLTDAEANKIIEKLLGVLKQKTGAELKA